MARPLSVACIQMNARPDIDQNLTTVGEMIREAAANGARLIATPENTGFIVRGRQAIQARLTDQERHPGIPFFAELAQETGAWLSIGSLAFTTEDGRGANRTLLFAPSGDLVATYDKIHMFDVDLGGGESYRESKNYRPGERAVLYRAPWGTVGLTICYDLRFPHLYRSLAKAGAEVLTIPSAFTVPTGAAHWHVLMRARAIETGCFVIAAAQTGTHDGDRKTYGHSVIVDPWGEVLADGGTQVGIVSAEIDLDAVVKARRSIPSLTHDRPFAEPEALDPGGLLAAGD